MKDFQSITLDLDHPSLCQSFAAYLLCSMGFKNEESGGQRKKGYEKQLRQSDEQYLICLSNRENAARLLQYAKV